MYRPIKPSYRFPIRSNAASGHRQPTVPEISDADGLAHAFRSHDWQANLTRSRCGRSAGRVTSPYRRAKPVASSSAHVTSNGPPGTIQCDMRWRGTGAWRRFLWSTDDVPEHDHPAPEAHAVYDRTRMVIVLAVCAAIFTITPLVGIWLFGMV